LGLAIVRQLVDLMGGEVGFSSEEGQGSTFWFQLSLPLQGAVPRPLAPLPTDLRLLVVDDNATNRRVVLGQLAGFGVHAEAVGSAPEALARLRSAAAQQSPYQVVVLDWHMPDMDGMALAKEIRADAALLSTPLVMLTSGMTLTEPQALEAVRFEALLNKPVRASQLHRALRQVLGHAHPDLQPRPAAVTRAALGELHLLVVEDNQTNQLVIQRLLEKLGCRMDFANNGAEAVKRVVEKSYSAVLMDCQMPVLDGYAATRQIRAAEAGGETRRVPIIALTAYAMAGDRQKCLEAGMDDYLSKPLREAELRRALEKCSVLSPQASHPIEKPAGVEILAASQLALLRELPGRQRPTLLEEVSELFREETPVLLADLRRLLEQRDAVEIARRAHRLAGSCANLGGNRMRAAALAVERAAIQPAWPELPELLAALEREWLLLATALPTSQTKESP
jgi:CheY-like chemotaxis protein